MLMLLRAPLLLRLELAEFGVVLLILLLEMLQIITKLRHSMSSPTEPHAIQRLLLVRQGVVLAVYVIVMIVFRLLVLVLGAYLFFWHQCT